MPIYLPAPVPRPGGPEGHGWNRLSIGSMGALAGDECALRPRTWAALRESQDTRRARYGGFGPCHRAGACDTCPVLRSPQRTLDALDDRVLARIHPHDGHLYLMNRPEDGWASGAQRWTWAEVARIDGWEIGRQHRDEHSDGFWLIRAAREEAR